MDVPAEATIYVPRQVKCQEAISKNNICFIFSFKNVFG